MNISQSAAVGGGDGFYFMQTPRHPGFLHFLSPGREKEQKTIEELFWARLGKAAHYFCQLSTDH